MKYQKLENQEANWKWIYLIRKHREGEKITRYEEKSLEESKVQELIECQNYPEKIEEWIKNHLSQMTLSETITYMIDERESKALYESQMTAMKAGLKNLLNK